MTEKQARALVYARSGHVCERCGERRAENFHHRQARGRGKVGKWTASNGMHLCGSGTTGCHGWITSHVTASRERGWSVPSWLDPAATPVWLAGHGWVMLTNTGEIEPTTTRRAA